MRTCDMFCRVIDNYGDAGVSWRLAQMLAKEYDWAVRLIIDDAAVLSAIVPTAKAEVAPVKAGSVTVCDWIEDGSDVPFRPWDGQAADVVIELFSCRLPDAYEAAIARRFETSPCAVFALDYLTAEKYAEEGNGLPSPHPLFLHLSGNARRRVCSVSRARPTPRASARRSRSGLRTPEARAGTLRRAAYSFRAGFDGGAGCV